MNRAPNLLQFSSSKGPMDTDDSDISSSSTGARIDGVNKNFQKSEDQMIINIIEHHFEGEAPSNKREYAKFSRLFHDDKLASQFKLKLPYFRDPNSLRRRLLTLTQKSILNIPPSGSAAPSKEQVLLSRIGEDPYVQDQIQNELQKKKRKSFDFDDRNQKDEQEEQIKQELRSSKKQKEDSFWDHPKADKFFELIGSTDSSSTKSNTNSIADYFSHKKALEELKDLGIIDNNTLKERIKELAIKFSIL